MFFRFFVEPSSDESGEFEFSVKPARFRKQSFGSERLSLQMNADNPPGKYLRDKNISARRVARHS